LDKCKWYILKGQLCIKSKAELKDYCAAWQGAIDEALKVEAPKTQADLLIQIHKTLSYRRGNPDEISELYASLLEPINNLYAKKAELGSQVTLSVLWMLVDLNKRSDQYQIAEKLCEEIIASVDSSKDMRTLARANVEHINILRQLNKQQELKAKVNEVVQRPDVTGGEISAALDAMLGWNIEGAELDKAILMLRKAIADNCLQQDTADSAQYGVVKLLLSADRLEEALSEARIYYYTAGNLSGNRGSGAISLVVDILKRADNDLSRVNRFLLYQELGPEGVDKKFGTADDLADILAGVALPSDSERNKIFKQAIDESKGETWRDHCKRANLNSYLGAYDKSLVELKQAFMRCPTDQKHLQNIVDQMTRIIVRTTHDQDAAEMTVKYIMYGSAGMDAKQGTKDDIHNPLPGILTELAKR
ncbi:hypothetical protein BVX97_03865, partial [bacterium E08(2017)]